MPDTPRSATKDDGMPSPLESTLDLIERIRSGDRDALDRLVARHAAPLRRWVSGRLPRWARDLADTDDLVQDTLLRTFQNIGRFAVRGAGALQAYLTERQYLLPIAFRDLVVVARDTLDGPGSHQVADPGDRYWDVLTWRLADGR